MFCVAAPEPCSALRTWCRPIPDDTSPESAVDRVRLAMLREAGLLESGADDAFDRFVRLTALLLRVPVAQMNLITDDRQVTRSSLGPEPWASTREVPLTHSYCQHVVRSGEPLVVRDAREHPVLRDNLATRESGIIGYAAMPIGVPGGAVLGTLCAVDFVPRPWSEQEMEALRDLAGGLSAEVGLRLEVSERRRAQSALEELKDSLEDRVREQITALEDAHADARLQLQAIEASIDGIATLGKQGEYLFLNESHANLYGYETGSELVGKTWRVVHPQEEVERFEREVMPVLAEQGHWQGEALGQRKDGSTFPVAVSLTTTRSGGIVCVVRDVSERKKLEQQSHQTQKLEAVGRLAGGVAHDFNNVLMAIKGHAELGLEKTEEGAAVRQDLSEINRSVDLAASLTRQLLAFSRKQVVRPRVIDPAEVVWEAEAMLRRLLTADIQMVLTFSPDLWPVKIDPANLIQVVMNLAVNARDAMPHGGFVVLELRNVEVDKGKVGRPVGLEPGEYVCLSVSDNGTGMSPELMTRILEPFFTTKEPGKGTGLGLSTVYGIVKQSGGEMHIESERDRGTTFSLFFPRAHTRPEEVEHDAPRSAMKDLQGSETILLIEDEPAVRRVISLALRRHGYTVLEAGSGEEAIQLAEEHTGPLHLLVSDIVLPTMNGRELSEKIREIRGDLPRLFMSGYAEEEVFAGLSEKLEFIEKPFSPSQLIEKIRALV